MCCTGNEVEEEGSVEGDITSVFGFTSSTPAPLETNVHVTEHLKYREKLVSVLQEAMKVVVRPVHECEREWFLLSTGTVVK